MSILTIILEAIVRGPVCNSQESLSQDVNFNSGEHLSHELEHLEPGRYNKNA